MNIAEEINIIKIRVMTPSKLYHCGLQNTFTCSAKNRNVLLRDITHFITLIALLFLSKSDIYAQLDDLHYIPPMASETTTGDAPGNVHLYISTPSNSNVTFEITDAANTQTYYSGVVSSGNSFRYDTFGVGSGVSVMDASLNQVLSSGVGFRVAASDDVYAQLRVRSNNGNQAGSLTSKGRNAFGKIFRLGSIPNLNPVNNKGSIFGITATEDNTEVQIDMTGSGVSLRGPSPPNTNTIITVNLNEGESYVMRANANDDPDNLTGMIGTLVTANRNIVINTGSWSGDPTTAAGRDYGFDQIVSVEKVGTNYAFIRAFGTNDQELPLIVAHYDDTEVYVNGSGTPSITLSAGEFTTINGSNYVNDVMYLTTSRPAFAYQVVSGGTGAARAGMNFVPDISCQIENNIDAIVDVNKIGNDSFTGGLSITTVAGSQVWLNNILETSSPETITFPNGNSYDVYRLLGLTGDQHIQSNSMAVVSYFGTSGVAGYGGYFSGFEKSQNITVQQVNSQFEVVESCDNLTFEIKREGDLSVPFSFNLSFSGTAQNNLDYTITDEDGNAVGATLHFGINEFCKTFILSSAQDGLNEGIETILLDFDWQICNSPYGYQQSFTIDDAVFNITCAPDVTTSAGGGGDINLYSEDFEGGASGWINNTTSTAAWSQFLGVFSTNAGNISKSYSIENNQVTQLDFDFYRIDSWDDENFRVYINGNVAADVVFGQTYAGYPGGSGSAGGISWTATPSTSSGNYVYGGWTDQIIHFTITIDNPGNNLTIGFESTLNQGAADEAWGIDNLTIRQLGSECQSTINLTLPTINDNCGIASISNDAPVAFSFGTTAVNWIVTNHAGNTTQCLQTVVVTNNEDPTIDCTILLPIELTMFEARLIEQEVHLNWTTSSETINDYFTVERSTNGIKWMKLENVLGAGNSSITKEYNATDYRPLFGTSYYRIKQTDFNGQFSYSEIRAIERSSPNEELIIYPNPTKAEITITAKEGEIEQVQIYDALGKNLTHLVHQTRVNNATLRVQLNQLRSGCYFVKTRNTTSTLMKH